MQVLFQKSALVAQESRCAASAVPCGCQDGIHSIFNQSIKRFIYTRCVEQQSWLSFWFGPRAPAPEEGGSFSQTVRRKTDCCRTRADPQYYATRKTCQANLSIWRSVSGSPAVINFPPCGMKCGRTVTGQQYHKRECFVRKLKE